MGDGPDHHLRDAHVRLDRESDAPEVDQRDLHLTAEAARKSAREKNIAKVA